MATESLPCIICERPLKSAMPGDYNHPSDGCAFTSYGHYGSTVFDPMDGTFLELNICDKCLTATARHILRVYKTTRADVVAAAFRPGQD
jgi:hypothetical protein